MIDTEKRYSQTEKVTLAIRLAKNRIKMYLLRAPRFKIITGHTLLLPIFCKATAKLTPHIEIWVMDMQDVDFELVYEPGKMMLIPWTTFQDIDCQLQEQTVLIKL